MAFFWTLVLALMVLMLWYYALRAAFQADSKQRRMAMKLIEEIESWFGNPEPRNHS
jgi:cbb3-type cytochrome oxidase subunit 3